MAINCKEPGRVEQPRTVEDWKKIKAGCAAYFNPFKEYTRALRKSLERS